MPISKKKKTTMSKKTTTRNRKSMQTRFLEPVRGLSRLLKKQTRRRYKKRVIRKGAYGGADNNLEEQICPVCLEDINDGQATKIGANCGHLFHANCIDGWCQNEAATHNRACSCPLCRAAFLPNVIIPAPRPAPRPAPIPLPYDAANTLIDLRTPRRPRNAPRQPHAPRQPRNAPRQPLPPPQTPQNLYMNDFMGMTM